MSKINLKRIRKALVSGLAAAVTTGGGMLGAGADWRAAAGAALGAAILAAGSAYGIRNRLGVNELTSQLDEAKSARRP